MLSDYGNIDIATKNIGQYAGKWVAIENGKETYLGGVGGRIKGYIHKLEVEVAGKKFLCPIVFSHEYTISFNLLGREAVFKRFRIIFEEKSYFLKFKGNETA